MGVPLIWGRKRWEMQLLEIRRAPTQNCTETRFPRVSHCGIKEMRLIRATTHMNYRVRQHVMKAVRLARSQTPAGPASSQNGAKHEQGQNIIQCANLVLNMTTKVGNKRSRCTRTSVPLGGQPARRGVSSLPIRHD